jgi:hypothetical protein
MGWDDFGKMRPTSKVDKKASSFGTQLVEAAYAAVIVIFAFLLKYTTISNEVLK